MENASCLAGSRQLKKRQGLTTKPPRNITANFEREPDEDRYNFRIRESFIPQGDWPYIVAWLLSGEMLVILLYLVWKGHI